MIQALNDAVLVKARKTADEIRESGIIVPRKGPDVQDSGEVWLVGEKVENIKPGDYVYFPRIALAQSQQMEGESILSLKQFMITAVDHK